MLRKLTLLTLVVLMVTGILLMTSAVTFAVKPVATPTPTNTPSGGVSPTPAGNPMTIFGIWHAGNHYCDWTIPREMGEFDYNNHWIIDRGDGRPSVNLVVLSFVNPLQLLNKVNDAVTVNGIPIGMSQEVVNYFKSRGIRVMLSIGGITYTDDWDAALATNPTQLGLNAAEVAQAMGVGIEIDYEKGTGPNIAGLQAFINAYRSRLPYDPTGNNHAARLTIDVAAGDRYLIELNRYATQYWLNTSNPVLDYANAMVAGTSSGTTTDWQEHIDGKLNYNPPVPPLAPCKFTGGLYLRGNMANCTNFDSSEQKNRAAYVTTVAPNGAGVTSGMLGLMFWAAEYPSAKGGYVATVPPNSCEGGMGVAATVFNIPIPMPALRQQ